MICPPHARFLPGFALAAATALASTAHAQEGAPGRFVLRPAVASVMFDSSAEFALAGQPVVGGDLRAKDNVTVSLEAEYLLTERIGVSVTMGIPPKTTVKATGTLAPLGNIGEIRYGTGVIMAKYHFGDVGPVQPWVGVGATRLIIVEEDGQAIPDLKVDEAWGAAFQVGADYPLTDRVAIHGSVSKLLLDTDGTGSFATLPLAAKVQLDPTIIQGGVALRF